MAHEGETFFTVVGCMDGRVQDVVANYGREKFGAQYADTITEAGIVGLLAQDQPDQAFLDSVRFKVFDVSVKKHNSMGVIVDGHAECAGNPVADEQHKTDIRTSVGVIRELTDNTVPVYGVFIGRSPSDPSKWEVEEV